MYWYLVVAYFYILLNKTLFMKTLIVIIISLLSINVFAQSSYDSTKHKEWKASFKEVKNGKHYYEYKIKGSEKPHLNFTIMGFREGDAPVTVLLKSSQQERSVAFMGKLSYYEHGYDRGQNDFFVFNNYDGADVYANYEMDVEKNEVITLSIEYAHYPNNDHKYTLKLVYFE
jgi:hypothetical protein